MWQRYISVNTIEEAIDWLEKYAGQARIISGATDLMLELERGARPEINTLIDISRIPGGDSISLDADGLIHLGPRVTHNDCVQSPLVRRYAFPLARAAWEVGSPQIRNRGTVVGNLVTASPANDTITPLMALDAQLVLRSTVGVRLVALADFYTGVRKTVLRPEEMVVEVVFPALMPPKRGGFIKYALRNAQAISLVNAAVVLDVSEDWRIKNARVTLGAVAPTIVHAKETETFLIGKSLDPETIQTAGELVKQDIRPIDDIRASAGYRKRIAGVIVRRALRAIRYGDEARGMPENPVLLRNGKGAQPLSKATCHEQGTPIFTRINGVDHTFENGQEKSLLRLLREEGFLIGTKEGCAEGECGACTVILDGEAVMSCMVPAPRAHGAEITTVEGLAQGDHLHPIQAAFVKEGAVQCGYCTPGFLVAGAALLQERRFPTKEDILQAFTGNLCRCTGYYKIIRAVERAVDEGGKK